MVEVIPPGAITLVSLTATDVGVMLSTLDVAATGETISETVSLDTIDSEEGVTSSVRGGLEVTTTDVGVILSMPEVVSTGETVSETASLEINNSEEAVASCVRAGVEVGTTDVRAMLSTLEEEMNIKEVEVTMAVVSLPVTRTPVDTLVVETCSVGDRSGDSLTVVVRSSVTVSDITSEASTLEGDTTSLESEVVCIEVGTVTNELAVKLLSEGEMVDVREKKGSVLTSAEMLVVVNKLKAEDSEADGSGKAVEEGRTVSVLATIMKVSETEIAGTDEVELLELANTDVAETVEVLGADTTDPSEKETLRSEAVLTNSKLLYVVEISGIGVDCVRKELTED